MVEIVIGTGNPHKRREIEQILAGTTVKCLGPSEVGPLPEVEEDGTTLEENAAKKACEIARAIGRVVVADDTGLEVDVLGGRPGVASARFAGPECDYAANNRKLLRELMGVPREKRTATFRCVIAMADPDRLILTVEGRCDGIILAEPRGTQGFGYDPLFYYPAFGRTFAELGAVEKNGISHRARALMAFRDAMLARNLPETF